MKHISVQRQETGFTDLFILTHADLTETSAATTQAITLATLAVGDVVMNNALLEVRTPGTVLTTLTGQVGVTGTPDQFIAASDLTAAGDRYFGVLDTVAAYVAPAAIALLFTADPDADALADVAAGEFWIWLTISRKADRNRQA